MSKRDKALKLAQQIVAEHKLFRLTENNESLLARQLLRAQDQVYLLEVIAAWREGDITEGQAAKLVGMDRVSLRDFWLLASGSVQLRLKTLKSSADSPPGNTPAPV